ncbi:hypothetical protein EMIT0324P_280003 [Pseudomonas chlororaphis]
MLCMRLLYHTVDPQVRVRILNEFARVARQSVILSLWGSNYFKPLRRQRTERFRFDRKGQAIPEFQSCLGLPAGVVEEFKKISRLDCLPFCGLGRIYVLLG